MDSTTLILIWLSIGFIGFIVGIILETLPKDGWIFALFFHFIGGPISFVYNLWIGIKDKREKREKELQLKLKKEKDKERLIAVLAKNKQRMVAEKEELRTAAAKKKQRIAAEKVESKERYGKLLSELETQMKSYEESDEPPSEKFFVDAVTLGADACNIPKSGLENEETLMNVLRYARLNIYTVFEGNTLEQGKTHADSLGSAIERLSR